MKEDWHRLGAMYLHHKEVMIADVDCTSVQGKEICNKQGISGFPTLRYFTPQTGRKGMDYHGERDFDSLEKFIDGRMIKHCVPYTKENCDKQEVTYIDMMEGMGMVAMKKEHKRLHSMKNGHMKPPARAWVLHRIKLLKDLIKRPREDL